MIEKYIADFDFAIILFISQLVRTECGSRRRRGLLKPKTEAWSNTGKKRFAAEEDIDFFVGIQRFIRFANKTLDRSLEKFRSTCLGYEPFL